MTNLGDDEHTFAVNISHAITKKAPAVLTSVLGSCIGICLHEPNLKVGSLAHAMLPLYEDGSRRGKENPLKYCDSAIKFQVEELVKLGCKQSNLVAKVIGGARMFSRKGKDDVFNIGERNQEVTIAVLKELGIKIVAKDLGLDFGRAIEFDVETGSVVVKKAGGTHWKSF